MKLILIGTVTYDSLNPLKSLPHQYSTNQKKMYNFLLVSGSVKWKGIQVKILVFKILCLLLWSNKLISTLSKQQENKGYRCLGFDFVTSKTFAEKN